MIVEIEAYQQKQHASALKLVAAADVTANTTTPDALTAAFVAHANAVLTELWTLADHLMFKYADGYINTLTPNGDLHLASEPYPDWWLKEVGFSDGPPPVPPKMMVMV